MKLPPVKWRAFGYCHSCIGGRLIKIKGPKYVRNFKKHVFSDHTKINKTKLLECNVCHKKFKQIDKLKQHFCETFKNVKNPLAYTYHDKDSEVLRVLQGLSSNLEKYQMCFNLKIAAPNIFPPLKIPNGWHHYNMQQYGNVNGTFFIQNCLMEKVQEGGENELLLDKNIEIFRDGTYNVLLGRESTYLFNDDLICERIGEQYRYTLKDPQVANAADNVDILQELDGLREVQKYIQKNQLIHRNPLKIRRKSNVYANPDLLLPSQLTYLTSLRLRKYWQFVEFLRDHNLGDIRSLSLPAQALLFLMRLRHGLPYDSLAIQFGIRKDTVKRVFWKISLVYYESSNATLRMWTENPSNAQKNQFFRGLIEEMDPLYRQIASRMKGWSKYMKKLILIQFGDIFCMFFEL